jgi:hypothetical protein
VLLLPAAVCCCSAAAEKKKPFDGGKKTSSDVDTLICTAPPPASLLLLPSAIVPLLWFRCGSWEIRHLLCAENTGFKKHLHGWIMWGEGGWSDRDRTAKVLRAPNVAPEKISDLKIYILF